ncbi:MAG: hypothetical protein R2752_10600 [Vicinamibacterales bacterium]
MTRLVWLVPLAAVVVLVISIVRDARRRAVAGLRAAWGQPSPREQRMDAIAASHRSRLAELGARAAVDDRTWNDLVLEDVFQAIDRTESTLGQHALYHRLRAAHADAELAAFDALVTRFGEDAALRERAQLALGRLRDPHGYDLWWLAREDAVDVPRWFVVFPVLLAAIVALAVFAFAGGAAALRPLLALAVGVNLAAYLGTFRRTVTVATAFRQIAPVVATAQALQCLQGEAIDPVVAPFRRDAPRLRRLKTVARWVSGDPLMLSVHPNQAAVMVADVVSVAYDYANLVLPVNATGMFVGAADLRRDGAALLRVVAAIGDVDAAVSVASLRAGESRWTRPAFVDAGAPAVVTEAVHPLVPDAVPNSIVLSPGAGVLVTGSNMSGKSTFLRTVGVNAVLARSLFTCFAAGYEAPRFEVRSCIGRADDLLSGKSYYLVEVEALLGLVAASGESSPYLFLLDEMFRGTNAVERIAAGQAVLTELLAGPAGPKPHVVLAATHDSELVDLLEGLYAPCHFGDAVTDAGLTFDYHLREGRATSRNAIALLRLHGAPPALVERALASAAALEVRSWL